jgi:hypothetical protein
MISFCIGKLDETAMPVTEPQLIDWHARASSRSGQIDAPKRQKTFPSRVFAADNGSYTNSDNRDKISCRLHSHWPRTSNFRWLFRFWWLILMPWTPPRRVMVIDTSESTVWKVD